MKSPLRHLPVVAGYGAVSIGALVLAGWLLQIELLKRLVPGLVAMNPATAICFALCGISLLGQRDETRLVLVARLCALLVVSVAISKFITLGFHQQTGVDQLLFPAQLDDDTTGQANRMAPNTALGFLLTGAALCVLNWRTRRDFLPSQFLALGAAIASLLALIGYAYGTKSLYGVGAYIPMALHTALTFVLLAGGILMVHPRRGLMTTLTGNGAGNVTARRLLPAAVLVPALLGWLCLKGEQSGFYDANFRLALMVVTTIVAFCVIIGWTAGLLCRADERRGHAEAQRAQAYEELRHKNEEIETDLDLAREIQQAFLPQQYINFPRNAEPAEGALRFYHRYAPTSTLGGDFSDILLLSQTLAGVFVCDVMGHGVRSALVTAIVRGQIEELMPFAHDPGRMLSEVNRSLCAILHRTKTPMFASAVYMVADVEKQELHYASAGHPSPLLARRGLPHRTDSKLEMLCAPEESGPALGVIEDIQYQTFSCPLQAGDLLILFTDGLVEIESESGEIFEEAELQRAIEMRLHRPVDQMLDEILEQARRLTPDGQFMDDICLLGLEVMEMPGKSGRANDAFN